MFARSVASETRPQFPPLVENPPSATIRRFAATAAGTATIAAQPSESSYHCERSDPRPRSTALATRARHSAASGSTPITSISGSPTIPAVSSRKASAGGHQLGRAQSSRSRSTSTGTAVPTWSGLLNRTPVTPPGSGASMTPPAISAQTAPRAPPTRPRATKAASSTRSV